MHHGLLNHKGRAPLASAGELGAFPVWKQDSELLSDRSTRSSSNCGGTWSGQRRT